MRVIRVATILTAAFWLIILIQQAAWIPHALQPRFTQDPLIGRFAKSYAVTSSIKIVLLAAITGALAFYVYRSRRPWAAAALCVLSAVAFWQVFLAGLPIFFRPPLGDGSFHGALLAYARFHSAGLWLYLTKLFLVLGCIGLWFVAFWHISHASEPEV